MKRKIFCFLWIFLFLVSTPILSGDEKAPEFPSLFFGDLRVNPQSGEVSLKFTKFVLQGSGGLESLFNICYHSYRTEKGLLGKGFITTAEIRLEEKDGIILLHTPEGSEPLEFISKEKGIYQSRYGSLQTLKKTEKGYILKVSPKMAFHFSNKGLLESLKDSSGRSLSYVYNTAGQPIQIVDHLNRYIRFYYTEDKLTKALHFTGESLSFGYDEKGNVKTILDSRGKNISLEYNDQSFLSQINQGVVSLKYNSSGQVEKIGGSAVENRTFEYTVDSEKQGLLTKIQDSLGNTTTYEYAYHGNTVRLIDPLQRNTIYYMNPRKLPEMINAPPNLMTRFKYDQNYNLVQVTDPAHRQYKMEYDEDGNLISSSKPDGNTWKFKYDSKNNLQQVLNPTGTFTDYQYDSRGNLLSLAHSWGYSVKFEYDTRGNLLSKSDSTGQKEVYAYDKLGRITELVQDDLKWQYQYSDGGKRMEILNSLGFKVSLQFNLLGKIERMEAPGGRETAYNYDGRGLLKSVRYSDGSFSSFKYDSKGQVTSFIDPSGRAYSFNYDALGRATSWTDPGGQITRQTYNARGLTAAKILPDGSRISYDYNNLGKMVRRTTPEEESLFDYDEQGNLVSMKNKDSHYKYGYDRFGRLDKMEDKKIGAFLRYGYNNQGLRSALTGPFGKIHYRYDRSGKLIELEDFTGKKTCYKYNKQGLNTQIRYPNGVTTTYSYNAMGLLKELVTRDQNGDTLVRRKYEHNKAFKRSSAEDERGRKTKYSYDGRGRLKRVTQEKEKISYLYDNVGNRLAQRMRSSSGKKNSTYFYGKNGQLLSQGKVKYQYDARGHLKSKIGPEGKTEYSFDSTGKLRKALLPGGKTIEYGYGPNGARTWKKVDSRTTRYLYDFENTVAEYRDGRLQRSFVYGPGMDDPISLHQRDGVRYFHQDGLGSVVAMTGQYGQMVTKYKYDAFGKRTYQGGRTEGNPYGFAGRRYDPETSLYYNRARYYDPEVGRFLSQDPLMFIDGPNLYAYCNNDPVNYIDPWGTWGLWESFKNKVKSGYNSAASKVASATKAVRSAGSWVADKAVSAGHAIKDGAVKVARTAKEVGAGTLLLAGVGPEEEVNAFRDAFAKELGDTFGGGYVATQLSNFSVGLVSGVSSGVKSLVNTVLHPINTAKDLWHAVSHPGQAWQGIKTLWNEYLDAAYNDPAKFARMTGHLTGEIFAAILGDKGVKAAGKALGKAANKARTLTQVAMRNRRVASGLASLESKGARAAKIEKELAKLKKAARNLKGKRPNLRKKRMAKVNKLRDQLKKTRLTPSEMRELKSITEGLKKTKKLEDLEKLQARAGELLKKHGIANPEGFIEKVLSPHIKLEKAIGKLPHRVVALALARRAAVLLEESSALRKALESGVHIIEEGGGVTRKVLEKAGKKAVKEGYKLDGKEKERERELREREARIREALGRLNQKIENGGSNQAVINNMDHLKRELNRTGVLLKEFKGESGPTTPGMIKKLDGLGK